MDYAQIAYDNRIRDMFMQAQARRGNAKYEQCLPAETPRAAAPDDPAPAIAGDSRLARRAVARYRRRDLLAAI